MKAMRMGRVGLLGGVLLVVAAVTAACTDSEDVPEGVAGSSASGAGTGGGNDGTVDGKGAESGSAGHGHAGQGGSASAPLVCDCGDDPDFVHVQLECACAAGLCTTLSQDLKGDDLKILGEPWVVVRGICAAGYQVVKYQEACENGGWRTYDADGKLVYSSYGPYGGPSPLCNPRVDSNFGDFGIGMEDPAKDCHFCLLNHVGDGGAGGGASFASCIDDDIAKYEPCEP